MSWNEYKLGEIADIDWGNTNLTKEAFEENGTYLGVSAAGIDGLMNHFEHEPGVLVLSAIGANCGKLFYPTKKFTAIKNTITIKSDLQKADPRYLFYFLNYSSFRRRGAGQPFITKGDVQAKELKLPHLKYQKIAASILDKADQLRIKDQLLLANYDELLQSIFRQLCNKANSRSKEVQLCDLISKGKNNARTGPFGSDLLHSEFVDSGVAVLGIDNVVNNIFQWGKERFITEEKYEKLKRYKVFADDVLITIMGTTGRSAVVPQSIPLAINTKHLAALTLDKSIANPYFISYSVHSSPYISYQLKLRNRGAIMEGLNLGIIKELKIKLPPIEAQNEFEEYFKNVTKQKDTLARQSKASDNLFQSLLQKAFKGELVK